MGGLLNIWVEGGGILQKFKEFYFFTQDLKDSKDCVPVGYLQYVLLGGGEGGGGPEAAHYFSPGLKLLKYLTSIRYQY